jgi:hypothetical protein
MHLPIASDNNGGTALPICFATSFFGPRIFSSALYFLRDLRLMSRMIFSDDDRPAGLRLISTPQVRMIKNTLLNQNYICPIRADGARTEFTPSHLEEDKNERL